MEGQTLAFGLGTPDNVFPNRYVESLEVGSPFRVLLLCSWQAIFTTCKQLFHLPLFLSPSDMSRMSIFCVISPCIHRSSTCLLFFYFLVVSVNANKIVGQVVHLPISFFITVLLCHLINKPLTVYYQLEEVFEWVSCSSGKTIRQYLTSFLSSLPPSLLSLQYSICQSSRQWAI